MSFFTKFKKKRSKENLSTNVGKPPLSCKQVGQDLQSFLDGESTEVSADDLKAHLEACKDCGLEAGVYRQIKDALSRQAQPVDEETLHRLRDFGRKLADSDEPN